MNLPRFDHNGCISTLDLIALRTLLDDLCDAEKLHRCRAYGLFSLRMQGRNEWFYLSQRVEVRTPTLLVRPISTGYGSDLIVANGGDQIQALRQNQPPVGDGVDGVETRHGLPSS